MTTGKDVDLNSPVARAVIDRIAGLMARTEVDEITTRFQKLGIPEDLIAATFVKDITGKPLKDIIVWACKTWNQSEDSVLLILSGKSEPVQQC